LSLARPRAQDPRQPKERRPKLKKKKERNQKKDARDSAPWFPRAQRPEELEERPGTAPQKKRYALGEKEKSPQPQTTRGGKGLLPERGGVLLSASKSGDGKPKFQGRGKKRGERE